ncbi:hypothetical protein AB4853_40120 [Bradyrhizobium sp. 1050_B9_N1_2]|uniref:ATP dependent DNA ligase n=1 Tax=Bradyrhizobium sp. 1050_B9_N1_2 TaxID=3238688 RepID=UPI003EDC5329
MEAASLKILVTDSWLIFQVRSKLFDPPCNSRTASKNLHRPCTKPAQIRKALDTVVSPKQKLTKPIKKPQATWVEPEFYADVEYRDITSEGLLRASSFKGLTRK